MSKRSGRHLGTKLGILMLGFCQLAEAETIILKQPVEIPIVVDGKQVGSTKAPPGSEIEVLSQEAEKTQVRFRNFEPVWVESSAVGAERDSAEDSSISTPTSGGFDLLRAIDALESPGTNAVGSLLQGLKYPDPESRGEFEASLASFMDAKTRISKAQRELPAMEQQVKRLRRNAEVAGRPNTLNPRDISGQERAQQISEQADAIEAEAKAEISNAQEQLNQAKSTLTRLFKGWQTAERQERDRTKEAERRVEDLPLARNNPTEEPPHALDEEREKEDPEGEIADAAPSSLDAPSSDAATEAPAFSQLSSDAELLIWRYCQGDDALASQVSQWTTMQFVDSEFSDQEASELVMMAISTISFMPDWIEQQGGRIAAYKQIIVGDKQIWLRNKKKKAGRGVQ